MAKVVPSALVANISGKLHGSCFQAWKGLISLRRSPVSGRSRSQSAATFKALCSDFSGCFYMLSADLRASWRYYSGLLPGNLSGFNAFLARQTALAYSVHPDLCNYFTAPCFYDPPFIPSPLGVCYYPDSGHYCLFWTHPSCSGVYVQGLVSRQLRYSNELYPKLHISGITPSVCQYLIFDDSQFYGNSMIRFSARSINVYGEVSASPFVIPPPDFPACLAVVYPNGGESFVSGSVITVLFRCKSTLLVNLFFSDDNGESWTPIVTSYLTKSGRFSWTVPAVSSENCLIKIVSVDVVDLFDVSDSVFEISNG